MYSYNPVEGEYFDFNPSDYFDMNQEGFQANENFFNIINNFK